MTELSTETLPLTAFGRGHINTNNHNGCPNFDAPQVTLYSITLLICLLGLVGNRIVLWFLGFCIKRNPFTVYILNLAIDDTGFLLFSVAHPPAYVEIYLFCDNDSFQSILFLFTILCVCTYSTSLYLLTAISTERCVSVLYLTWHLCHRLRQLSAIVSSLLWALSCLFSSPVAVFCLDFSRDSCATSFLPICFLNVLIFNPVMVLSSLTLFIQVQRSSQRRPPGKLYAVILLTVLFFLLFTLPQNVQIILFYPNIHQYNEAFHVLSFTSSSINPFIYFLVGSYGKWLFCGSLKLVLKMIFEEQTDPREDRDPSPPQSRPKGDGPSSTEPGRPWFEDGDFP